jgi:hypothetical protein
VISFIVVPSYHTVQQGECLASISKRYGFQDYKSIYYDENNADFRERRPNPNVICPGDQLYIPDRRSKIIDHSTDQRHVYVLKRQKVMLRVIVQDEDGNPTASAEYKLMLPGGTISGTTSVDGLVEHEVSADLDRATLDVTFNKPTGQQ